MEKFAERLKEIRTEKNLSQQQLAELLSVNQRSISNWEKAVREPNYTILVKLAETFDVSTDYLLGIKDT